MNGSRRKRNRPLDLRTGALILFAALACQVDAAGQVLLIVGPPGSGKTTQAQALAKERGMMIIAADDLIARNQQKFARFKNPNIQGVDPQQDPAMNALVEEALGKVDVSKGVILEGYPAAKSQGDFLASLREKLNLPKTVVIHLRVPDDVVRKRLAKQKRSDLEQELKNYHREFDFVSLYFPQADIREVDGTKKPKDVAKEIRKLLESR